MKTFLHSIGVFALVFGAMYAVIGGSAEASPHKHKFTCRELRGLARHSVEYRDTLDACIWDFNHPDPRSTVH